MVSVKFTLTKTENNISPISRSNGFCGQSFWRVLRPFIELAINFLVKPIIMVAKAIKISKWRAPCSTFGASFSSVRMKIPDQCHRAQIESGRLLVTMKVLHSVE